MSVVLRFVMLLSLVVWVGGIVFFAFVVAPAVFTVLPTHELAGRVVVRSLDALHWIGIFSGVAFVLASLAYSRLMIGSARPLAISNLMVYAMIGLTAVLQFVIIAKMNALHAQMGVIDEVALSNPLRVSFDTLHQWSTGIESAVLLLGLGVIFETARRFKF
jgi:uncharacterized membrane protein